MSSYREDRETYPNSHTNAPLNIKASRRNILIHISLDLQLLGRRRRQHADVDFSVCDVDAELRRLLERFLEVCQRRGGAGRRGRSFLGQVALVADAVDADAVGLDELDDALGAGGFGAVEVDVVVVVEELRFGGVLAREAEGDGEVGVADGVVEDAFAVGSVFVQGCVLNCLSAFWSLCA